MKELTIEEKAKAYDEAIKVIKDNLNALNEISKTGATGVNIQTIKNCFYRAFPKLKESEDEKIRKALINGFNKLDKNALWYNGITNGQILAWLEKQGKQKPADKVEPKFEIEKGKWYVCDTSRYTDFMVGKAYYCPKNGMLKPNENAIARYVARDCFHPWTIQDAKDGDVLAYRTGRWIFIYKEKIDNTCFSYYALYSPVYQDLTINDSGFTLLIDSVVPATKEQRDTLLKAMDDAGYTFDFKNKKVESY